MNRYIVLLVAVVVVVNGVPIEKTFEGTTPGTSRDSIDNTLADAEQNAGKAVLKLLDAKIGRKVQDAAKEVTDFLTSAIGHHATSRTNKLRKDKQQEMSLLHLGAMTTIKNDVKKHDLDEPHLKKKKDGSFLVHFKIPYIVTPIKKKKHHYHHHHHKHHHKHHHHPHHRYYHHKHKPAYDKPPPVEIHRKPYHSQALSPYQHPGTAAPRPYTHTQGYGQDYTSYATQAPGGFSPCQGMCTAPCTPQCTPASDCCCCPDPNAAIQPAAVPVSIPPLPVMSPPMPPPNVNQPALTPGQFNALPLLPGSCLPSCKRHCIAKCPRECCGVELKRDTVEKPSETKEDKPEKKETKQESEPEKKQTEDDKKPEPEQVEKKEDQQTQPEQVEKKEDQQTQTSEDQREEGSANEATDDDDVE